MLARSHLASLVSLSALALVTSAVATACGPGGSGDTSSNSSNNNNGGNGGGDTSNGGNGGSDGGCSPACTGATPICDPSTKLCLACTEDSHCDAGFLCNDQGACIAGCNDSQPCGGGLACCAGTCRDLQTDPQTCGACDAPCPKIPGAAEACENGLCTMGACDMGPNGNYADCNLNAEDGCEWDLDIFGPCTCEPGATQECYTGAPGTKDVGTCKAGITQCLPDGANWGPCMGEVIPVFDECGDGKDNDCNGAVDDTKDLDGDGWTKCDNDCCDAALADGCGEPGLVNPGAFDVAGNDVDDDCDGTVDNPPTACDANLASNSGTATDYAKAIELCNDTVQNPANLKDKKWGLISAKLSLANGSGNVAANSKSIRNGFGANVVPLGGSRIAVLSTGAAADQSDSNPAYQPFQTGANMGTSSAAPADWLALNGGTFPNAPGCDGPSSTTANDPVMLSLEVRVPTNAKSFSVSSFFFSSEYPEWVCSPYNDFFVLLLESSFQPGAGQVGNPTDLNLAFYDPPPAGGPVFPVGVNLASGQNGGTGLFNQCKNGLVGCAYGDTSNVQTCVGTSQLVGTGFDLVTADCNTGDLNGGGTGWLTTNGNVAPGEVIKLRFAIWDTSDHIYDSLVLLDNFQWSLDASTPGTHE